MDVAHLRCAVSFYQPGNEKHCISNRLSNKNARCWRFEDMAESKSVVVWGDKDVLGTSIEMFLNTKKDWQVFRIANKEDLDTLVCCLEARPPDIFLIHQGAKNFPPEQLKQLLMDFPDTKVIMLDLESNMMDVYSSQKVWVKDSKDLIQVIETEFHQRSEKPNASRDKNQE